MTRQQAINRLLIAAAQILGCGSEEIDKETLAEASRKFGAIVDEIMDLDAPCVPMMNNIRPAEEATP